MCICSILSLIHIYVIKEIKFLPCVDKNKKVNAILIGFQWVVLPYWVYVNLLAIPPSSKEHSYPRMKVGFEYSFNELMEGCSWWHLSPTDDTPLSGQKAAWICWEQYSDMISAVQLVKPWILVESPSVENNSIGGLKYEWHPPTRQFSEVYPKSGTSPLLQ